MEVGIVALGSGAGVGGGTGVYIQRLVEALAGSGVGHTFVVIHTGGAWAYRTWPSHIAFAHVSAEAQPMSLARHAWHSVARRIRLPNPDASREDRLARQINALGLDVLHFPATTIYPLAVTTPCVLTFFDLQCEYYPQFFTQDELEWRRQAYRASVVKAAHVIVPSQYTEQTLADTYGVAKGKMTRVAVGISRSFGNANPSAVDHARRGYGLPELFALYPANPWPHKNHARLMAALRVCRDEYGYVPHVVLSGRLRGECRDASLLALAAGVDEWVHDVGFVPVEDLPALYTAARMMVFPSLFEGFGIPLTEAMACGCPISAANATAIPECVGDAALLFDPFDPRDIARAIHQLWTDDDARRLLAEKGRHRVAQYDWEPIVARTVRVYEKASMA